MLENHWLNRTEYPFSSHYFDINGYKLHYIDEGVGDVVLFVHGTPSWSFDFRNIIKALKSNYRCMAIDHIGFGLSDKPVQYDYSTQNHSLTLEQFVREKKLERITLVLHDFGGPIGLDFAIKYPEKIKQLVLLNTWMWSSNHDPEFIRLRKMLKSPLLPFLYRYLNFSPKYILPQSFGEHKLPNQIQTQYTKPFANPSQRNGALAFARSLLLDQNWFEELWNKRMVLSDLPTLLIWGMKDPVIKPRYLAKFQEGLPQSRTVELETCGHFPQEEQPEKVVMALLDFFAEPKRSSQL